MDRRHHHHHQHHHGRREEEEYPPPPERPPPPPFPPPPQVYHTSHTGPGPDPYPPPPPPPFYGVNEPPPLFPPPPQVYHTSHTGPGPGPDPYPHAPTPPFAGYPPPPPPAVDHPHHHPHMPHFPHHKDDEFANKPTVRVFSKAETNYSLTIRDGKVILARSDPSDPFQHWIKDERLSTRVKDEEGFPSFALINKATGQAMKHSIGATQPVRLSRYDGKNLDESVLWTESKDLGDSYRAIRMVSNIKLNVDVFNGDKNHGGVHDGSAVVLWEWKKGDNQRWKIVPYS